ncbi:MAG: holo-ACP synthase [Candidatus Sabulitectum sp.]|nr:holo-ACP synthase [Candidatus Sabulitectum sp.]
MVAGVGIDIVDVATFRSRLDDRLIAELFLPAEIEYCRSQVRYWENFAARFAAKEAAFKALGAGLSSGLRFKDVEIVKCGETGNISIKLHGKALAIQDEKRIDKILVSVSHTKKNAIAIIIAEGKAV